MLRTIRQDFDYTNKDFTAFKQMMIDGLRQRMPEYTDLSDSDAGIVIIELCAMGLDILSYYNDVVANESFLTTLKQRTNAMKWCKIFGYIPQSATPARFKQVFYLTQLSETDVTIPIGTVLKAVQDNEEVLFETASDLLIPAGSYGNEKNISDEYIYTVDVIQGVSVIQEVIGSSTGASSQIFSLNYYPVIEDSIIVYVDAGAGSIEWTYVTTFMDSSPTDNHYTIQYNGVGQTQIVFGDGVFGALPNVGVNNVICTYRAGGGISGNVGARKITRIVQEIPMVETFNPYLAYEPGIDAESLESIKMKAPSSIRTLWGALTLKDFGDIMVKNFPEISDAVCVEGVAEDSLIIFVIMKSGFVLSAEYTQVWSDFFAENDGGRKIVGVDDISFLPAAPIGIDLTANLIVDSYYSDVAVKALITTYVQNYMDEYALTFSPEYFSLNQLARDILTVSVSGISGIRSFSFQTAVVADGYTPSQEFTISPDFINMGKGEIVTLESLTITTI